MLHRKTSPTCLVLGCNILHAVMVQIFSIHQQSVGRFVFSETVCNILLTNRDILTDVPFLTISLQAVATVRAVVQRRDASYSHCTVCSCQLAVVALPWLLAAFLATAAKQGPSAVITGGNNT